MVSAPVDDKRLTVVAIHRDELVIIVPPNHPFSPAKKAAKIITDVRFPIAAQWMRPIVPGKPVHERGLNEIATNRT